MIKPKFSSKATEMLNSVKMKHANLDINKCSEMYEALTMTHTSSH